LNSGLYTAFSGMQAQLDALEILANNLANVNTTAFKEQNSFITQLNKSVESMDQSGELARTVNQSVMTRAATNMMEGSLAPTHRDLDVAIEGNGFLVVQTPNGIRYTRNGNLHVNSNFVLTTSDGFPVLGADKNQPISVGPGIVKINKDGEVSLKDKEDSPESNRMGRLKIVAFEDLSLLKMEGNSLFSGPGDSGAEKQSNAKIKAGFLEQSNVNAVSSVVKMVSVLRHFEAIQKSINLMMNDINAKAIDKLGR
jgi:flagellar basal-body rod protein FlgF